MTSIRCSQSCNWVAREDNIVDFPNMVELAEAHGIQGLVILETKPDATMALQAPVSRENLLHLAAFLKAHRRKPGVIPLIVEPCISPLRAEMGKAFL
ncbi:hypothetical protein AAIG11_14865 [Anoxynatronum sibiricum]|uniref:Uncharacterized protein n=1 Tax=Anoxynatronum sibiricum TaxID=210623 RepID=A0ABU9VX81_9CLOT